MATFNLISYNTHLFYKTAVAKIIGSLTFHDKARLEGIIERLRSSQSDMVMLSEVWSTTSQKAIIQALKDKYPHHISDGNGPFSMGSGLLLLSSKPIDENNHGFVAFKDSSGEDALSNKGFIFAIIEIENGRRVRFIFSHTQADTESHDYRNVRNEQFKQIEAFINGWYSSLPLIITGDLNVPGHSTEHSEMMHIFNQTTDSWLDLHPKLDGYTYDPTTNALARRFGGDEPSARLDYFLEEKLLPLSMSVITDWNINIKGVPTPLSDHYPIEGVFQLE
ncbi:hypothetical protein MD535_02040 [Vibrio sp. ZSDZ65]|uniref:Endonuclease/exonuclease/phosphatase domain-containing protein n=1 Tax=Vibrio qingdaonensis TaxID=2829491 RepID=A0A9X3CLW4_9VIBR|nr:endonuclease/exonuclease/phosphatase family protein [Vibrio qingdaonensis]MCW8344805.1 hypothetical protein [Vibrio qingdaonensis]